MPLYSAGSNTGSRLGRVGPPGIPGMIQIETKNFICLAVGWRHNILIYSDGSAVGWGDNSDFQLALSAPGEFSRPRVIEFFNEDPLRWAHCGDKITTFLTNSGKAYVCGFSTNKSVLELRIPVPCIYVSSGTHFSVALDKDGAIYKASSGNTSAQKWVLPNPVCDCACGNDFILALTTQGQVFCLGNFAMEETGSINNFLPIPSLMNIHVSRVFAYNEHAAIITRDGRIMMCGKGTYGCLGFGDQEDLKKFEFLTDMDGANIVEIDLGDNHTIFISLDGEVYGCGKSTNGCLMCAESFDLLIPTRSMQIPGQAVFVRCGCSHTVIVTDSPKPIHPGLAHFHLLGNLVSIPRSFLFNSEPINSAASSLTSYNLMPGDIIESKKYGKGFTVGVISVNVVCCFNNLLKEVPIEDIKFINRKGFKGITSMTANNELIIFDGGDICSLFGFHGGDKVIDSQGKQYIVLGFAYGTIWFQYNNLAYCLKDDSIQNLHRKFKFLSTLYPNISYHETKKGILPIFSLNEFYVRDSNNIYHIFGEFGNFYYGKKIGGNYDLISKQNCYLLQYNLDFYEFDRVLINNNQCGTVLSCFNDSIGVLLDEDLINNIKNLKIILNKNVILLSRFAGNGYRIINNIKYNISLEYILNIDIYPCDLIYQNNEIITIIGFINDKIYYQNQNNLIFEFNNNLKYFLIRRHFNIGKFISIIKSEFDTIPNVNLSISSMNNVGLFQGDEIQINRSEERRVGKECS